ncbi:MAG: type II toxin-antitoxin system RelE family toxin [Sporichthyaceae bacterium]
MTRYIIEVELAAARALSKLDRAVQTRLINTIEALAENPRPAGATKLVGQDAMRLRAGDYRIVYVIDDTVITVTIVKVGHRSNVYKR